MLSSSLYREASQLHMHVFLSRVTRFPASLLFFAHLCTFALHSAYCISFSLGHSKQHLFLSVNQLPVTCPLFHWQRRCSATNYLPSDHSIQHLHSQKQLIEACSILYQPKQMQLTAIAVNHTTRQHDVSIDTETRDTRTVRHSRSG